MNSRNGIAGVVGVGQIGSGVVRALAREGIRPRAYDIPGAPGLQSVIDHVDVLGSPREVGDGAEIVFLAVWSDDQVRDALGDPEHGVFAAENPPRVVLILSTVKLATVQWAADEGAARGIQVLDSGVTGGPGLRSETGKMVALVGGSDEAFAIAEPWIEPFASTLKHMGPLGAGITTKLVRNMVVYGCWSVVLEAAHLADRLGIDVTDFAEVNDAAEALSGDLTRILRDNLVGETGQQRLEKVIDGVHKDVGAALAVAAGNGIELPVATVTKDTFAEALEWAQSYQASQAAEAKA